MLVDSEGYLWIEAGHRFDATLATWSVFTPGGDWLTDIDVPADMDVLEVGSDHLLVRMLDEFDVESVHLLTLARRGRTDR